MDWVAFTTQEVRLDSKFRIKVGLHSGGFEMICRGFSSTITVIYASVLPAKASKRIPRRQFAAFVEMNGFIVLRSVVILDLFSAFATTAGFAFL